MTYEQLIAGHSIHVPEIACPATLLATITAAIDDCLAQERADRARRKKERYLSFEIQDYLSHAKVRDMSAPVLRHAAHCLRLLLLAANDLPVEKIRPLHLKRFRKVLRYWPKNTARKGFEYLTDSEILAVGKKEAAPPPSLAQKMVAQRCLRGFFDWLVKHQRLVLSPYELLGDRACKKVSQRSVSATECTRRGSLNAIALAAPGRQPSPSRPAHQF